MKQYAESLAADRWDDIHCDEEIISNPTWEEVKRQIERLDAETWTMLTIYGPMETMLTIGGGGGKYVVILTTPDQEFWNLKSGRADDGTTRIFIGGQEGDYPSGQIVDLPIALQAAEFFWRSGEMATDLIWELQA